MAVKKWTFNLDIKEKTKVPKMILVQGDTNSNVFEIHLKPDVDLTDTIVTLTFLKEDDNVVVGEADILDKKNGIISYTFKGNELSYPGTVVATVEVYSLNKISRYTSTQFRFQVIEQLDNGESVPSTEEYGVLTDLIHEVVAIKNDEELRKIAENERDLAEAERKTNEINRINAENNRQDAFNNAMNDINVAINNADIATNRAIFATDNINSILPVVDEKIQEATIATQNANQAITSIINTENMVQANEQERQLTIADILTKLQRFYEMPSRVDITYNDDFNPTLITEKYSIGDESIELFYTNGLLTSSLETMITPSKVVKKYRHYYYWTQIEKEGEVTFILNSVTSTEVA